ncbi:N-acetylmuramoyl-L-alanine amidase [Thalassospira mesophila]|uniref:N-acetylmuramoyl-L-alanine amidase n=1 Tax=Thalassospira mesophila TaxID=1293891 RepID=A0A1Y2L0D3_9PROT|nr:N-acetylmuramoyl-L-alanine amidase [Thalassospira mesophila]
MWHPSPNFGDRPADCAIDMLVLHYTGMPNGDMALTRMCDPASQVSAHYMVEEDGCIYQLVAESKRAWHGGRGYWRGCTDVNSRSVGIEIVNPGHEFGYRPFAVAQIDAVITLCQAILRRHNIPAHNIIAHSDMAPDRKEDPGELFPWHQLAENGIGLWPRHLDADADDKEVDPETVFDSLLQQFGYGPGQKTENRIAFQRHWHPQCLNGPANAHSIAILKNLIKQCPAL